MTGLIIGFGEVGRAQAEHKLIHHEIAVVQVFSESGAAAPGLDHGRKGEVDHGGRECHQNQRHHDLNQSESLSVIVHHG